jgi:hypothetical protein
MISSSGSAGTATGYKIPSTHHCSSGIINLHLLPFLHQTTICSYSQDQINPRARSHLCGCQAPSRQARPRVVSSLVKVTGNIPPCFISWAPGRIAVTVNVDHSSGMPPQGLGYRPRTSRSGVVSVAENTLSTGLPGHHFPFHSGDQRRLCVPCNAGCARARGPSSTGTTKKTRDGHE